MMQQLQQRGISILNFVLYHRQCPEISVKGVSRYLIKNSTDQPLMVLISSERKAGITGNSFDGQNLFRHNGFYLVLGERLVKIMENAATQAGQGI